MNRDICETCKHYYMWEDIAYISVNNEIKVKTFRNEVCSKANRDIDKIKRCNGYEEIDIDSMKQSDDRKFGFQLPKEKPDKII